MNRWEVLGFFTLTLAITPLLWLWRAPSRTLALVEISLSTPSRLSSSSPACWLRGLSGGGRDEDSN